ncbi:hypothetical protein OHT52_01650 [Streptomyces sp. NBC_00247]|uniref:hypothetical protein n=1 Tax=Streptomyces sp. NBC_00247 TaxID=2975689 RepID=UPI002E2BF792|nr:hypothetical protein [Streptomyces sp. NBC_00247]
MIAGPERAALLRRSVRVTVAASAGFHPVLYAAGLPVTASYALFALFAMGLLSRRSGGVRTTSLGHQLARIEAALDPPEPNRPDPPKPEPPEPNRPEPPKPKPDRPEPPEAEPPEPPAREAPRPDPAGRYLLQV